MNQSYIQGHPKFLSVKKYTSTYTCTHLHVSAEAIIVLEGAEEEVDDNSSRENRQHHLQKLATRVTKGKAGQEKMGLAIENERERDRELCPQKLKAEEAEEEPTYENNCHEWGLNNQH